VSVEHGRCSEASALDAGYEPRADYLAVTVEVLGLVVAT
jgi:hypothetical protein